MDIEAIKAEALRLTTDWDNYTAPRLQSIRYIRESTGMDLIKAKHTLEQWELSVKYPPSNPLQRTITWHPISEIPDIDPDEPEFSKIVLAIEGTSTCEAYCRMDTKGWLYHGVDYKRPFAATHWSYIDFLPE